VDADDPARGPHVAELLGEGNHAQEVEGIIVGQGDVLLCESLDGQANGCVALPMQVVDPRARWNPSVLLGERTY